MEKLKKILWYAGLVFVSVATAYDTYWALKVKNELMGIELNPVGRFLINLDNGDSSLFLTFKAIGLSFVIISLFMLRNWNVKYGALALFVLMIMQIIVIVTINTSHF